MVLCAAIRIRVLPLYGESRLGDTKSPLKTGLQGEGAQKAYIKCSDSFLPDVGLSIVTLGSHC